jgi:hypothetical protein
MIEADFRSLQCLDVPLGNLPEAEFRCRGARSSEDVSAGERSLQGSGSSTWECRTQHSQFEVDQEACFALVHRTVLHQEADDLFL